MKANDTVSILESLVSKESIDRTIRDNFIPAILILLLLLYAHWNYYLPDSNRSAYIIISFLALLKSSIIFNKYRNPFHYSPSYMLYVRDRNDSMIIMKPYIDPLMIKLGLIKPEEFVDVRYSMYPDLDLGVDFDTDTGYISGYPMESGNHVSQVKMTFLGGSYSTTARIEVANTLKVRASKSKDDFAQPLTDEQLLLREEDLKIREDKIDEEFEKRRLELEDEYLSKQRSLEDQLNLERQEWSDTLEDTKEEFEQRLQIKEEEIDKIKLDTSVTLQQKEKEFVELQDEMKEKVSSSLSLIHI